MKIAHFKLIGLVIILLFIAGNALNAAYFNFLPAANTIADLSYSSIAIGDIDNDYDYDIIISGYTGTSRVTKVYKLTGSTFTEAYSTLEGVANGSLSLGDYDRDGDVDLLLVGQNNTSDKVAKIYKNDGSGAFTDIGAALRGMSGGKCMWIDYDRDGDLDVLISGEDAYSKIATKIYKNTNGTFTEVTFTLPGIVKGDIQQADVNKDGYPDLLITGSTGSARISKIFCFNGTAWVDASANIVPVESSAAGWCDYNNDGWEDLFLMGFNGSKSVAVLYNNIKGTLTNSGQEFIGLKNGSVCWGDRHDDYGYDLIYHGETDAGVRMTPIYNNENYYPQMNTDNGNGKSGKAMTMGADGGGGNTIFGMDDNEERLIGISSGQTRFFDYNRDGYLDCIISGIDTAGKPVTELYYQSVWAPAITFSYNYSYNYIQDGNKLTIYWDQMTPFCTYNVMAGTQSGATDLLAPNSHTGSGYRRIPETGNTGKDTFYTFYNLPTGKYYCNVQLIKPDLSGGSFLQENTFKVLGVTIPKKDFGGPLCPGSVVEVPFTASDTFSTDNSYILQLSDKNASFTSPFYLDTIRANYSDTFRITLPNNIPVGDKYRFRVISTAPYVIGKDNGKNFSVIHKSPLQLVYPADGETMFVTGTALKWIPITNVDGYVLEIYDDNEEMIEDTVLPQNVFTYIPLGIERGKKYFWRMMPVYGCGDGDWTDTRKFSTLSLTMGTITSNLNGGDQFTIMVYLNDNVNSDNQFIAELSDANGDFTNPTTIGTVEADSSIAMTVKIPDDILSGSGYRIRVRGTSPAIVSPDNGRNITIDGVEPYEATVYGIAGPLCAGTEMALNYYVSNTFTPGNKFTVQLSSVNGYFSNPVVIGTVTANYAGTINIKIPDNTLSGKKYRIRLLSSMPQKEHADNGYDIEINALPSMAITGLTRAQSGKTITYSAAQEDSMRYVWSVQGGEIVTGSNTPVITVRWSSNYRNGILKLAKTNTVTGCTDSVEYPVTVYRTFVAGGFVKDASNGDAIGSARVDFIGGGLDETVTTAANGTYTIELPDDISFIARAFTPLDKNYIPQYYDAVTNITEHTPVLLTTDNPNINFRLSPKVTAQNKIYGKVVDESGANAPSYLVLFYVTAQGEGGLYDAITYDAIETDGSFEFSSLPAGSYVIMAVPNNTNLVPGYFVSGKTAVISWLDAEMITINYSSQSGPHLVRLTQLPPSTGSGKIHGEVVVYTGGVEDKIGDIPQAKKSVSGAMTFTVDENDKVRKYDFSDNQGSYIMQGLDNGNYVVKGDKIGYELYENHFSIAGYGSNVQMEIPLNTFENSVFEDGKGSNIIIAVYPNPNNGQFTIKTPDSRTGEFEYTILDVTGQQLAAGSLTIDGNSGLNLKHLAPGTYFLKLRSGYDNYYAMFEIVK